MDGLRKLDDGSPALETPRDARIGASGPVLDPLAWIRRITAHIPDPGRHFRPERAEYYLTLARSFGTMSAPSAAASVEKKSTWWTISFDTCPAGIRPGQRMMHGVRIPPSMTML